MVTEIQQTIINKLLQVPDMSKVAAKAIFNMLKTEKTEKEFLEYMEKNPQATIAQLDEKAMEIRDRLTPEYSPSRLTRLQR